MAQQARIGKPAPRLCPLGNRSRFCGVAFRESSATVGYNLRNPGRFNDLNTSPQAVTQLLVDWGNGDRAALEKLTPLVYQELRRLAARYLRRERREHTLQSTALVHEAWLRLIDQKQVHWQNRAQFFGIAAEMIRRILIDHARNRQAAKRGDGAIKLTLDDAMATPERRNLDLVALDDALKDLAKLDPKQGKLVELRFFAGLSIEESAEVLDVSPATVKREWAAAKAWLYRQLSERGAQR